VLKHRSGILAEGDHHEVRRRGVFLLIEPVADYTPLAPVLCARRYGRDCQFNEEHELGRILADEILQTRVEALVYREYAALGDELVVGMGSKTYGRRQSPCQAAS
jgi:hypothetical protein